MFINETTIEYDPCPTQKKVYVELDEEVYEKNLRPSFKLGRIDVGFFAYIVYCGSLISLILVRKKSKKEYRSASDRLGLNVFLICKRNPPTSYSSQCHGSRMLIIPQLKV